MTDTADAWWEKGRPMREWAESPLGKLFVRFESATGRAWQLDATSENVHIIIEAWENQRKARDELLSAIGAPVENS